MKQLKRTLNVWFLFVLVATVLVSCKTPSAVLPTTTIDSTTTKIVTTRIHDTIFHTQVDSSYYKAYIECVNGKPIINQQTLPEVHKGNHVEAPKVILQNGQLNVNCKVEAQQLFAQWKDEYTASHQQIIKNIPYPVPLELSWWEHTEIILGRVFLGILILVLIAGCLRLAKFI